MSTPAFPLSWPTHRQRTAQPKSSPFSKRVTQPGKSYTETKSLSVADAIERLQKELNLLGATDYVLSSNLALRLDGLPRSGQGEPEDTGVALYFQLNSEPVCLPCDRYDRVADNIAAIAAHIGATRAIERWGVASVKEMFTGFMALPAPGEKRHWHDVFGFGSHKGIRNPVNREMIESAFRRLSKIHHPDTPNGSHEAMSELTQARAEALREIAS